MMSPPNADQASVFKQFPTGGWPCWSGKHENMSQLWSRSLRLFTHRSRIPSNSCSSPRYDLRCASCITMRRGLFKIMGPRSGML